MTPPDSDLTLREVWRGVQRIEAQQMDMLRRMDRMHDDFVSQRQFDDHVRQSDAKHADTRQSVARVERDVEALEQRVEPTRTSWTAVAAVIVAIVAVSASTIIQLVTLARG